MFTCHVDDPDLTDQDLWGVHALQGQAHCRTCCARLLPEDLRIVPRALGLRMCAHQSHAFLHKGQNAWHLAHAISEPWLAVEARGVISADMPDFRRVDPQRVVLLFLRRIFALRACGVLHVPVRELRVLRAVWHLNLLKALVPTERTKAFCKLTCRHALFYLPPLFFH